MLNSEPTSGDADKAEAARLELILRSGAPGAVVIAGISTAVVVALWFAFYFLVFVPRATMP